METPLKIYQCLCDETRLRILNLLNQGPLCVCHIQEILDEPQVKISKHLAFLRRKEMVISIRHLNWRIYRLPDKVSPLLLENLRCLQDLSLEGELFRGDLRRLAALDTSPASPPASSCCTQARR